MMGEHVIPVCRETGLWYYFVELTWKQTEEGPLNGPNARFLVFWPRWCRAAVEGQPEEVFLNKAITERLKKDPKLESRDAVELYKLLRDKKCADAVPVLLDRYYVYNEREVPGKLESYPGSRAITYRGMFEPIISFADTRHAGLLEDFIAEHPMLVELNWMLEQVRERPAPAPTADPPFRLGTTVVQAP